ncbi:type II secretion system F family protein [bacterium]|nr:type II secretion system F family protein [bacterium]MCG2678334.1 type II secretion system F family protein [bacterium]
MPNYTYKARDKSGLVVTGTREAPNERVVADRLSDLGYYVISVSEEKEKPEARLFTRRKKVTTQNIVTFTRQMATMIRSGMTFTVTLDTLSQQTENPTLREVVGELKKDIEGGLAFSDALAKHPRVFSELYVNMVRAGEAGGVLEEILERLIFIAEREGETRARLRAALTYPTIVVSVAVLVIGFLAVVVFPRFMTVFAAKEVTLPLPTRILLAVSNLVQSYWWVILGGVLIIVFSFRGYSKTEGGGFLIDRAKLKIPIFGLLIKKLIVARFARILSTLHASGVPILSALEIVERTIGNVVIARAVENVRISVREGESIAEPLRISKVFPPMVVHMITIGEESGALDKMLTEVADTYDREVDYALKNVTAALEPILIVVMGIIVAFIALSLFLPYFDMIKLTR